MPGGHQRLSACTVSSQPDAAEPFSLPASISSSVLAAEEMPEEEEQRTGGVTLIINPPPTDSQPAEKAAEAAGTGVVTLRKVRGNRARVSKTPGVRLDKEGLLTVVKPLERAFPLVLLVLLAVEIFGRRHLEARRRESV